MFWQACLDKNLFLLFLVSIVSYELAQAQQSTPASTTKGPRSTRYRYRGRYNKNYGSRNYGSGNMGGYYDNNGDYNYYKKTGSDGIDPRRLGTDIGDFGPVYDNQPAMSASMDIFIRWADDWLSDKTGNNYNGNNYNGNNYNGNNYNRNNYNRNNYNRNNYNRNNNNGNNYNQNNNNGNNYNQNNNNGNNYNNNNYQQKRSYNRVRVPVRHYPDAKRSPIRRLPPLISILPGIPVFFDRITYQTLIFSPAGGVYIIPPVINFYGRRFAVAQLIKWGYASLVSSGVPPGPGLNVAPLVQPAPVGGPAVGFNSATGRFNGGIKMNSRNIGPQYPKRISKREIIDSEPSSGENYAPNSN